MHHVALACEIVDVDIAMNLIEIDRYWLILIDINWYWLVFIEIDWYWLILIWYCFDIELIDIAWNWLTFIEIDWYWLMLIKISWLIFCSTVFDLGRPPSHICTSQYSHTTSGFLVKHHSPPGFWSGLRQKLFAFVEDPSGKCADVKYGCEWGVWESHRWHGHPLFVTLILPTYSAPRFVLLQEADAEWHSTFYI